MTPPGPESPASAQAIKTAYTKALQLQQAGRVDEAATLYKQILAQRPLAEPMYQLGIIARQAGRQADAAKWFSKALKLKPKEPALWEALVSVSRGKARDAVVKKARAAGVALSSKAAELLRKADELADRDRLDDAEKTYLAAIRAGAPQAQVWLTVSEKMRAAGRLDTALGYAERAISLQPAKAAGYVARALVHVETGEMERSNADLRKALELSPYNTTAWNLLMTGSKQPADSPDVALLERRIREGVTDPDALRRMSFALAKALEDQKRYAEVFTHLNRANRLTARKFPYGFEADLKQARETVQSWRPVAGGYSDSAPIFVTGLPRSGTTLVETILAMHPDVVPGGELGLFRNTITPRIFDLNAGKDVAQDAWRAAGRAWDEAARTRTGAAREARITDKSISTFSMIGHVLNALPKARFVVLGRDRRDVGLSIYKNMFADGMHRYANNLTELGRYIRLFDACVAAWQKRVPDRIHIVDYAALTADPEPHIRALLEFCDLDWHPDCLTPEQSTRSVQTLSFAQVRQPIYKSSVAAWKRYEDDLQPLIEALDQNAFDLG